MTHAHYWKVKAAFYETKAVALEARAAIAKADAQFDAVMRAAGLDPRLDYDLDDATESITPRSAPVKPGPVKGSAKRCS